jgi:hypothetical protein
MPSYPLLPLGSRFTTTLTTFAHDPGNPFADALPQEFIDQYAEEHDLQFADGERDIYTPAVTLWAFLTQVASAGKSCFAAVARVAALRIALGLPACSAHTGGYCKARAKLPEEFLCDLTYAVGDALRDQTPKIWRWHGHDVHLIDGTEATMADTAANQRQYPQPESQKPGLGFPMMRLVVLLTFATAALTGAAFGPYAGKQTGETALFRRLFGRLRPGDVVVADRYYCSYAMIALLQQQGVLAVFRLHQLRGYDFRRGQRLGPDDHVVNWLRPERPDWMDAETYAALPEQLTVREIRFPVSQPGYRTKEVIVATTLCDAERYPKDDIAELYHSRWHIELDIRSIKQTLRMDHLLCKTPAMVRRELWAHLLAYNLVRKVMVQAALVSGRLPRQVSFAGALQTLEAFRWQLLGIGVTPEQRGVAAVAVLVAIGSQRVGERPGRVEPRRVKRRPKKYKKLREPRRVAQAKLRAQ